MALRPKLASAFAQRAGLTNFLLLAMLGWSSASLAAPPPAASRAPILLEIDGAQLIRLNRPATTVFVANPDIADVQVPSPTNVIVFGKKVGATMVYALGRDGAAETHIIEVRRPTERIAATLRQQAPTARLEVASAPNGIIVSGSASSPDEAEKIRATAQQFLGDREILTFNVAVDAPTQISLQVRVAEVSRRADKQFGVNWDAAFNDGSIAVGLLTGRAPLASSTFGSFARDTSLNQLGSIGLGYRSDSGFVDVSTLLDALQTEGLVSILAEPNLTAISGATSNFLAGGEFPVPVSQGPDQITIVWKSFGISVDFTPTVLSADRISIKVRPEVSQLSDVGAVVVNNIRIPSVTVRRADTTVELASGQSFAIAGLFQKDASNQIKQLPGLGDLPILGALFRSTTFQKQESELVIIVTPYVVRPVSKISDLRMPNEGLRFASDLEQILLGRLTAGGKAPPAAPPPRLNGPAGFILEK